MTTILPDRLAAVTTLARGAHDTPTDGLCVMEAAAWIAGEPHSGAPTCVSPVIAAFLRPWNDALPDADRTRLLLPLIPETIGTRTTPEDEETRAWLATDWLVRMQAPAWLRLAGLTKHALTIEACAPIVNATTALAAQPSLFAARAAAMDAAMDAARASLAPTVAALQSSAVALVRAMCAVGRTAEGGGNG